MINKCLWSGKSLNSDHADCACGLYVYTPVSPEVTRPRLVSVYLFSAFRSYLLMLSVHSCNYIFIYALKKGTFCLNLNCFFLQFFKIFSWMNFFPIKAWHEHWIILISIAFLNIYWKTSLKLGWMTNFLWGC